MALVKVIVPSYGYAHHLRDCVASVVSQEVVQTRVLIVDDCSPDDTEAAAAALVAADERVEYMKNPENLGLIGTANRAGSSGPPMATSRCCSRPTTCSRPARWGGRRG